MKCKHCNKEIVYDKEDGYWDSSLANGNVIVRTCFCNDDGGVLASEWIFHSPDYFQEYLKELNEMH